MALQFQRYPGLNPWVGGWDPCAWRVRVRAHRPGTYLQDGPPALGCMLAAGWATPRHAVQGHIAVSTHTVGAVVVIDEAGPELGALPANHLKWQMGQEMPDFQKAFPLQGPNSHDGLPAFPHPALSEVGLQVAGLAPPWPCPASQHSRARRPCSGACAW